MADKLSERLEALRALAECTDDAERDHNAPDAECVFVDVRPAEFEALLREAIELARMVEAGPREKVTHWEQAAFAKAGVPIPDEGSYVRLVPEPPEVG